MDRGYWWATVPGVAKRQAVLNIMGLPFNNSYLKWRSEISDYGLLLGADGPGPKSS